MKKEEWILPYIKQNARLFVLVIFLGAVTIFSAAFLMFTSGFLISKAATRRKTFCSFMCRLSLSAPLELPGLCRDMWNGSLAITSF